MTLTIPTEWGMQTLSEAAPGRVIATGKRQDLRTLNRNILRNYSANAASNLAVLSVPEEVTTGLSGSFVLVGKGRARLWGNGARLCVHVYGRRVEAYADVGGVSVASAVQGGGTDAWASGTPQDMTGMSIDGDGFVDVDVYARLVAGPGTRGFKHILLEELPVASGNMPGPGHANTDFISMHDDLYSTADSSVDVELAQTLDDRVRQAMRERSPRCLHLYCKVGEITRLASVHWRLDGPYVVQVPPYCDRVDVDITLEVIAYSGTSGDDFAFFALTEFEKFEDVASGRIQIASLSAGAPEPKRFLGLKARPGQPCMVWVAYKSRVGDNADTDLVVGHHSMQSPERLYCSRPDSFFDLVTMPWDLCIVADSEDVAASSDPAIKNARGYSAASGIVDVACFNGLDPNTEHEGSSTELILTISPHPGTGISTSPSFNPVPTLQAGVAVELRYKAVAQLLGVYVEANVAAPVRSKRARARRGVSSGIPALVMSRVNNLTVNCTPLAALRHGGQRLIKAPTVLGGGQVINHESTFLHVQGSDGLAQIAYWQVPLADPNGGTSTGLLVRKLYGRAILMCVNMYNAANGQENLATVGFSFSGANEVLDNFKLRFRPNYGRNQSPTEADAVVAAWATHVKPNAWSTGGPVVPGVEYTNAYTQTNTWPSDGYHEQRVWDVSPVFEMNVPESFPAIATIEIYPKGTTRYEQQIQTVVAGLHLWWGPRT